MDRWQNDGGFTTRPMPLRHPHHPVPATRSRLFVCLGLACALASGAITRPDDIPAFTQGIEALSSRLWEIAAARFETALTTPNLDDKTRAAILLRLAEAQTRGDQAEAALATLSKPEVATVPAATYWKGMALAGCGRFREATDVLATVAANPDSGFPTEAAFTRASLLLSLGDTAAAKTTLEPLVKGKRANESHLMLAEIAFEQGDYRTARALLDKVKAPAQPANRQAEWLDARLLLEEDRATEAVTRFHSLVDNPEGQSLVAHHSAMLGLSDALAVTGATADATEKLVEFIQNNPRSPVLEAAFRRLRAFLPEKPAPTDPILEQMAKWVPPPTLSAAPVPVSSDHLDSAWPATTSGDQPDLAALALYHRAHGLRLIDSPPARAEAYRLLRRLRLDYPTHFLARRSLLDVGRWLLEDKKPEEATAALASLEGLATDPTLKAAAAFLAAKSAFLAGRFEEAAGLFTQAAAAFDDRSAETAMIDAGVARMLAGQTIPPTPTHLANARTELQLERALFLAAKQESGARTLLDSFLLEHPDHRRAPEARLALARTAIFTPPADTTLAEAQLDAIAQVNPLPVPAADLALARIHLRQAQGRWQDVTQLAQAFLADFPNSINAPEVTLLLGTAQFRQGDFHPARITLAGLAESDTDPARANAARFLAARAAALGATSQARAESLAIYDQVIAANGTLADAARLEKARTLIDLARLQDAAELLRPFFRKLDKSSPLRLPVGALLGETLFAMGGNDHNAYQEALALYETLAATTPGHSAWHQRFQYLRGLTLEQVKRTGEALDTYYSVLESAKEQKPEDWQWLERSGFRALALLEGAERWQAAASLASTIASFQGPRAKEAAARSQKLRLEHMIWEN